MSGFAYRMPMTCWYFAIPSLVVLVIGLSTVIFQSLKAAKTNPVIGLRKD
jgi:putative ABC transport system permease protein